MSGREFDALFNKWLADSRPDARMGFETETTEVRARIRRQFEKVLIEKQKRKASLAAALRSLGISGGVTGPNVRRAMKEAGFTPGQLEKMIPADVVATLEQRVRALGAIGDGRPAASAEFLKSTAGGGRPKGTRMLRIRREMLLERRSKGAKSEASFAAWLGLSKTTYRRAAVDGLATSKTAEAIARKLCIDVEDLLKKPVQKTNLGF